MLIQVQNLESALKKILLLREQTLADLRCVQALQLKNACIAAGYVRNQVWDYLHGYAVAAPFNDVDVIYYDPEMACESFDRMLETRLKACNPAYKWSVKNQARMHVRNQSAPYAGIEDAMKRWPETATSIGVRLNEHDEMEIIAPHGLEDLFALIIRKSPFFEDNQTFLQRIRDKGWLKRWHRLKLHAQPDADRIDPCTMI